jgi:3-oxoacyl-[acyl-carrier-protein] synthase II
MRRAVAITGIGTVGSYGSGFEAAARALATGAASVSSVNRSAGYHSAAGAGLAALVPSDLDLSRWLSSSEARRMSPSSRLAVVAARMALENAGISETTTALTGVFMATALGQLSFSEDLLRLILKDGPKSATPFLFNECVANAPAGQVAINCGAKGPSVTVVQREAGALVALGRGAAAVAQGRADRVLVGAVDELTPLAHSILDRFGALARARPDAPERARPFDRRRNGFIAAEGATVLLLEPEADARARDARVLAKVVAAGGGFDATASRVGWGHGVAPLARGLRKCLARAERAPTDVDRIVSGANGAIAGDRLEGSVLHALWPKDSLPPVLVPKAITGEYGGGFLAAIVAAMQAVEIAFPDVHEVDPDIQISPPSGSLSKPRCALATSLAAGGAAAWILLEAS